MLCSETEICSEFTLTQVSSQLQTSGWVCVFWTESLYSHSLTTSSLPVQTHTYLISLGKAKVKTWLDCRCCLFYLLVYFENKWCMSPECTGDILAPVLSDVLVRWDIHCGITCVCFSDTQNNLINNLTNSEHTGKGCRFQELTGQTGLVYWKWCDTSNLSTIQQGIETNCPMVELCFNVSI